MGMLLIGNGHAAEHMTAGYNSPAAKMTYIHPCACLCCYFSNHLNQRHQFLYIGLG